MSQITFTAVKIINPKDILKLQQLLDSVGGKPGGWMMAKDYHMTITLGELPLGLKMRGDVGSEVQLTVNRIGISDDAIAAGVTGYMSKNDNQHITLAYKNQPADSKGIIDWYDLEDESFVVTGVITEYPSTLEEVRGLVREIIKENF